MKKLTLLFILFALGGCVATEPVVINKYEPFTNDSIQNAYQAELEKVDKLQKLKQYGVASEKLNSLIKKGSTNAKIYAFNEYKSSYQNEPVEYGCYYSRDFNFHSVISKLRNVALDGVRPYMFEAALCKFSNNIDAKEYLSLNNYLDGLISQGDPVAKALDYFGSLYYQVNVGREIINMKYYYPFLAGLGRYKEEITIEELVGFGEVVDFILAYGEINLEGSASFNQEFLYNNDMCFGNGLLANKGICTKEELYTKRLLNATMNLDASLLHIVNTLYRNGALKNKGKLIIALGHLDRLLEKYESNEISKTIKEIRGNVDKLNSL